MLGRALAVLVLVSLAGCYDFPLDPSPQLAIDAQLIGTWRCLPFDSKADEKAGTIFVASRGAREYAVTWRGEEDETERYRAYLSTLPVPRLMNVQELKEGKEKETWVFVRYTFLRPGVLQLQYVENDVVKGAEKSPIALRRAIERQRKNPALFADWCVCLRANR